jgi:WD40 repeat protein/uncharacterized caspase-like protein
VKRIGVLFIRALSVRLLILLLLLMSLEFTVHLSIAAGKAESQIQLELALQTGHTGGIVEIMWSPDGRYVTTLGSSADDGRLLIWEPRSGRVLADLKPAPLNCFAWSPDSRMIAVGRKDNRASVWDTRTGQYIAELKHPSEVREISFSPSGKHLSTLTGRGVTVWDCKRWQSLIELDSNRGARPPMKWSPGGRYLVTAAIVWEMPAGVAIARLPNYQGHPMGWDPLCWSPRGDLLAAGNNKSLRIWETAGWQLVAERTHIDRIRALAWSPDGNYIAAASNVGLVWQINRGVPITVSKSPVQLRGHSSLVYSIAWSGNSMQLATGSNDSTTRLWQVSDWTSISELRGHEKDIQAIAYSPAESLLATASADHRGKIWNAATGELISDLKARTRAQRAASFSPDGKLIASGGYDSSARVWEVQSGQVISIIEAEKRIDPLLSEVWKIPSIAGFITKPVPRSTVRAISWDRSSQQVAVLTSNGEGNVLIWDTSKNRRVISFKVGQQFVYQIAWSPNGKYISTSGRTSKVGEAATCIWQAATGKLLAQIDYQREREKIVETTSLAWSPDSRYLARGGTNVTAGLFDMTSGQLIAPFTQSLSVAWSEQGCLAIRESGSTVKIWDSAAGKFLNGIVGAAGIDLIAWSPDAKFLGVSSANSVFVLDRQTGAKIKTLQGHEGRVEEVNWSPDGRFIITAAADATVKIWSAQAGKLLATMIVVDDDKDWLITTPDGLFDGSPSAWKMVGWHTDASNYLNVDPVEIFFREFYYPGLLTSILSGRVSRTPRVIAQADRRQPVIKLSASSGQSIDPTSARVITVKLDLSEASPDPMHKTGSGVRDVRLFRNGSLVHAWRGDVLKGSNSTTLEASVSITAGPNRLVAYAFNHDNVKSADAELTVVGAGTLKRKGSAYILAIGTNQYSDPDYNLSFAVADAQAFGKELQWQQQKLANYDRVEVIGLYDKEATKANLLRALAIMAGADRAANRYDAPSALAKLKPTEPEDAVFVYFAGHGKAQGTRFHLIPHDLGYTGKRAEPELTAMNTILEHSISDLDLEQAFEKIDAGRILLAIDACNSGQALEAEEKRRGPMNSKGLAQLAYEKGMYILTAAQGYQAALEAVQLGHGLLTYALVEEGLKTVAADSQPKDGAVLLREWLDYATLRVPQLQETVMKEARKLGREIAVVDGEEKIREIAKRSLQRPRVFYRREPESDPLVVARP